jgi:hypothetical protein
MPELMDPKLDDSMVEKLAVGLSRGECAAISLFNMEPDVLAQLLVKAAALASSGKLDAAEELLVDLDDLVPTASSIACLLADLRLKRGDPGGALRAYDSALLRASKVNEPEGRELARNMAQLAFFGRGQTYLAIGEVWLARLDFESATSGEPHVAELAQRAMRSIDDRRDAQERTSR